MQLLSTSTAWRGLLWALSHVCSCKERIKEGNRSASFLAGTQIIGSPMPPGPGRRPQHDGPSPELCRGAVLLDQAFRPFDLLRGACHELGLVEGRGRSCQSRRTCALRQRGTASGGRDGGAGLGCPRRGARLGNRRWPAQRRLTALLPLNVVNRSPTTEPTKRGTALALRTGGSSKSIYAPPIAWGTGMRTLATAAQCA